MKTIIVGGGKVGFYLTNTLLEHGYEVTIIEKDKEQSRYCANNLEAEVACGDGTSYETLFEACEIDKTSTYKLVLYIIKKASVNVGEWKSDNYRAEKYKLIGGKSY